MLSSCGVHGLRKHGGDRLVLSKVEGNIEKVEAKHHILGSHFVYMLFRVIFHDYLDLSLAFFPKYDYNFSYQLSCRTQSLIDL